MKSSSHVFADRLFMFFPWLGVRALALLFQTLLRLDGFLFWLFLTIFRNSRQTLPALHAERSGAICKIGAAIGTIDNISYSALLWAVFGIHAGFHDPSGGRYDYTTASFSCHRRKPCHLVCHFVRHFVFLNSRERKNRMYLFCAAGLISPELAVASVPSSLKQRAYSGGKSDLTHDIMNLQSYFLRNARNERRFLLSI